MASQRATVRAVSAGRAMAVAADAAPLALANP